MTRTDRRGTPARIVASPTVPTLGTAVDRRAFLLLAATAALAACSGDDGASPDGPAITDAPSPPGGTAPDGERAGEIAGAASRRVADPDEAAAATATMNQLGGRMYADLLGRIDDPNLVFSPASVAIALAMTRAGALGATATEMDDVLAVDDATTLHRSMNALTAALADRSGTFERGDDEVEVVLALANSLWAQAGLAFEQEFLDVLSGEYGAGLRVVDYEDDAEGARVAINDWVDDETRGRIPSLIGQGVLGPMTRLVLVNAVYLKAPWADAFPEGRTSDETFTTLDGDLVDVPTMTDERSLPYAEGDGWRAVEIPYVNGDLAMVLVLPDLEHQFAERVVGGVLDEVVAALVRTRVLLRFPRFDIGTSTSLRPTLEALGMPVAFTDDADFSAMTTEEPLAISDVVHEANITVDEDGTEAAAATAVVMEATSDAEPDEPVEIVFDRPFVFALRDRSTGAITFLGRIGDPSASRG